MRIRLGFGVEIAKINNHLPTINSVLVCRRWLRDCEGCTAPFAGHTTLKPTKFPEISLDDFSEYLMFVSMIFIRALFFCLVPFTKLDEGFTKLSTDRGVFDQLP